MNSYFRFECFDKKFRSGMSVFSFYVLSFVFVNTFTNTRSNHHNLDYIPDDWIDPTLRHYDRPSNKGFLQNDVQENATFDSTDNGNYSCCNCSNGTASTGLYEIVERAEIFMRRFVNHFLRVANLMGVNMDAENDYLSEIQIKITKEELVKLRGLGQHFSAAQFDELDQLFVKMFVRNRDANYSFGDRFVDPISNILESREKLALLLFFAVFGLTLWMFASGANIIWIMTFLYLVFFMFGVAWNFWHVYQRSILNQYVQLNKYPDFPPECNPTTMGWFVWITSLFKSTDECLKHYEAIHVEPLSTVNPAVILSDTFFSMVIRPLGMLGEVLGTFTSGLTRFLPWPLNWILFPVVLILVAAFILFIISLRSRQQIKIWSLFGGLIIDGGGNVGSNQTTVQYDVVETATDLKAVCLKPYGYNNNYILVRRTTIQQALTSGQSDHSAFVIPSVKSSDNPTFGNNFANPYYNIPTSSGNDAIIRNNCFIRNNSEISNVQVSTNSSIGGLNLLPFSTDNVSIFSGNYVATTGNSAPITQRKESVRTSCYYKTKLSKPYIRQNRARAVVKKLTKKKENFNVDKKNV